MKRTTISLPDDLAELIEHEAKRQGVSVSEWIRRAVRKAVLGGDSGTRPIPWAGIFDDPTMVRARDLDTELEQSWADDLDRDR